MKIAHKQGKIIGTGPVNGDFESLDIATDLSAASVLHDYKIRQGELVPKLGGKRAALVSVWDVPCGISTYAGMLWSELSTYYDEWKIFAEEEDGYSSSSDGSVTRCWRRGRPLSGLLAALKDYDPDVIFVQHEYGYFPLASHWISFMGALSGHNVVTTLHSVYRHPDKIVVEAACPKIIVHTNTAKDILLNEKEVSGSVEVIPHGCSPLKTGRFWNLYGTSHTILQFGFGFRYKGWDNALQTIAEVKKTHPDVFFTALLSERTIGQCSSYLTELNQLAVELGIEENIGLIQGFQSSRTLDAYLRTNKVALFPYRDNGEHTVYGCSGAARVAMSAGVPVIASGAPLFEDLEGVVPRPTTVEGWSDAILEVFNKTDISKQNSFLEDNSWKRASERYWSYGSRTE